MYVDILSALQDFSLLNHHPPNSTIVEYIRVVDVARNIIIISWRNWILLLITDALLEDLQRSVSRPGSSLGGAGGPLTNGYSNGGVITTGFREFAKSTRTEKSGQPAETNKEYHIEYLNPSNSTTVLGESKIPNFESFVSIWA